MTAGPATELVRPIAAERVGAAGLAVTVEASEAECAAVAARLMLPGVASVRCEWQLRPSHGGRLEAEGSLRARLQQVCVVSLDAFESEIVEEFAVQFVRAGAEAEGGDDPDEPDEIPFEAGMLDLGEATVQQLALALEPYPRKPGAELTMPEEGGKATPWDALAHWRERH